MSPNLSNHCCLSYQNVLTYSVPSPFPASQSPWTLGTVHCLLCSLLKTFHLSWSLQLPRVSSSVSCKKLVLLLTWGSLPQTAQPLPRSSRIPTPISSRFCMGFSMHGREAAQGPSLWNLLRHLSNSETHFYLFTVNSYRCSQQPGHFC